MHLAETDAFRNPFLAALGRGGTPLFSWTLALEASGPQGQTAEVLQRFLSALGEHWLPLEFNVFRVARREAGQEAANGHPCVSASFVIGYVKERLYEVSPEGSTVVNMSASLFDLGRVVAWIQRDRSRVQVHVDAYKEEADRLVQQYRAVVARAKAKVDELLPAIALNGSRPATALLHGLLRPIVLYPGSEKWARNDALDLSHAVVGGGCGELIALDKTWKRRTLATGIETARGVQVFHRPELERLIEEFQRRV
jgi:hypothetical protein